MKAAYKWRLQNGIYGYLTDETGNGEPFVYDVAQNARIYIDGTIVTGSTVNESSIANSVSRMTKHDYTNAFNNFKQLVDLEYPQVTLLDVIYYYNVESDECTASSSALKCSATDIIFHATAETVEPGETATATVVNEQPAPSSGDTLIYRIDFDIPRGDKGETGPVPSVSATASAITVDSNINASAVVVRTGPDLTPTFNFGFEIPRGQGVDADGNLTASTVSATTIISDTFVKSGGTSVQYLMADGSVTTLTAGTNVNITKDNTTGVVTISAYDSDTNTWRPVKVNGNNFLGSGITTNALNLSAGTNVTLNTSTNGTITISANDTDSNTWRKIRLNGSDILGTGTNTNPLNLSSGANVTLTNNNGTVTMASTDEKVKQEVLPEASYGYRPLVLGHETFDADGQESFLNTVTNTTYVKKNIYVGCGDGAIYTSGSIHASGGVYGSGGYDVSLPIGTIVMWPGSTAPSGWLMCTGGSIEVTTATSGDCDYYYTFAGTKYYYKAKYSIYRNLVKIIGRTYGHIEKSQTILDAYILLPDFRGMFPVGAGQAPNTYLGTDSQNLEWTFRLGQNDPNVGEYRHMLTTDEMPSHAHDVKFRDYHATGGDYTSVTAVNQPLVSYSPRNDMAITVEKGGSQPHKNVPPFIVLNFIIKYA